MIVVVIALLFVGVVVVVLANSARTARRAEANETEQVDETRAVRRQLEGQAGRDEQVDRELGNEDDHPDR